MSLSAKRVHPWIGMVLLLLTVGLIAGCEDTKFDRNPPAGLGSLIVDNFTGDRLRVYIDGDEAERVSSGDYQYYDLTPGVHRVALDGDDIRRAWAGDVDVLQGRRTVLEVRGYSGNFNSFDVRIYFD